MREIQKVQYLEGPRFVAAICANGEGIVRRTDQHANQQPSVCIPRESREFFRTGNDIQGVGMNLVIFRHGRIIQKPYVMLKTTELKFTYSRAVVIGNLDVQVSFGAPGEAKSVVLDAVTLPGNSKASSRRYFEVINSYLVAFQRRLQKHRWLAVPGRA
jgi:hypothetical protein